MIAQHVSVCPLQHSDADTPVWVEPTVAVHDESADVVIIAAPDVLYRDDGAWVWRETKTTAWRGALPSADLLSSEPRHRTNRPYQARPPPAAGPSRSTP